ncbi:shikimate dehydrogenase [Agromyces seonyuensis]|uniref:shikimate dehydrogenase n=1 Tax=Agromyces seonyuensis TaxID=2662446 RepID=UPI001920E4D8
MSAARLAVLGSPIRHSKSPVLHAAAYGVLGLDWEYGRAEVGSGELAAFLDGLDASWRGLSLTMPLKAEVIPLLDEVGPVARATGAVNTLRFSDEGRRIGFNTDVGGIVAALRESGLERVREGVLIGGGSTAGSAVAALAELGAEAVRVHVRSPERAAEVLRIGRELGLRMSAHPIDGIEDAPAADVVVGALPGGTDLGLRPSEALLASTLFDVAYDPWPTTLAAQWSDAGSPVVDGILMLLHQAVLQVRIFVGGEPNTPLPDEGRVLEAMRIALREVAGR